MDDVIDLQHSIEPRYRENAVFLMSDNAVRELRKYRTVGIRNVWEGDMQNDAPVKLLGVPVITCRPMPYSFTVIPGAKFHPKTAWSKCTHFPLWVHNKTIARLSF